jgi:hypothetical protein
MSLDVPAAVLDAAERGEIDDAVFLDVVRTSLPYAWDVVAAAAADRNDGGATGRPFGEHEVPPPSEAERGSCCGRWQATPSAARSNATTM